MSALRFLGLGVVGLTTVMLVACDKSGNNDNGSANNNAASTVDAVAQNEVGGSGAPLSTSISAPFVLFQDTATAHLINRDGGAVQRNGVRFVYSFGAYVDINDGNRLKLLVNDRNNSRILIFNSIPTDATAQPDVVVGQTNFNSDLANAGNGVVSEHGFSDNAHVSVCANGKMFVADRNNNRVLGYNTVPTTNGAVADFVIGQPDFTATTASNPPTASSLSTPHAAYCMDNKLFVLDRGNSRVLVYDPIPSTNMPAASYVIGQPDMATRSPGCTANKLNRPYEILRHNGKFYIADGDNNRVLEFASIPTATNPTADVVLGQPNMTSCAVNGTGSFTAPTETSFAFPKGLAAKGNVLAVSDYENRRIMFFTLPLTTHQAAYAQFGQLDFVTNSVNTSTPTAVDGPKGLIFDTDYLWVTEAENNRVSVVPLP